MSVDVAAPRSTTGDPEVLLLVATAVGFVEARLGTRAVDRLRDLAAHDAELLTEARALAHQWEHVPLEARRAAIRLLNRAARG